jgi:hypothetical protein
MPSGQRKKSPNDCTELTVITSGTPGDIIGRAMRPGASADADNNLSESKLMLHTDCGESISVLFASVWHPNNPLECTCNLRVLTPRVVVDGVRWVTKQGAQTFYGATWNKQNKFVECPPLGVEPDIHVLDASIVQHRMHNRQPPLQKRHFYSYRKRHTVGGARYPWQYVHPSNFF